MQPAVTVAIDLSAQGVDGRSCGFHYLDKVARGRRRVRNMTGQLVETPRDSFVEAAEKELIAFERKEREFRKREKQERAEQLKDVFGES